MQVSDSELRALTAVDVKVFVPTGILGTKRVTPAPLPGQLTVNLPDEMLDLRVIVSTEDTPPVINGVPAHSKPHEQVTAKLTLDGVGLTDSDKDGVPDGLDDCPSVYDPDQKDSDGIPPGDLCGGFIPPPDMAGALPGDDMAMPPGSDMASPDMATGPDMGQAVSLCPGTFLVCDGFEGATLDGNTWTSDGTKVSIDTTKAFRGMHSLKVSNNAGQDNAHILETKTFMAGKAPTHFFARAFVFVPSGFGNEPGSIISAEQNVSPFDQVNVQLENGSFSSFDNLSSAGMTYLPPTPVPPMPKDKWSCLEWEVDLSAGVVNLWLEGNKIGGISRSGVAFNNNPAVAEVVFGLTGNAATARTIWFDEVVVDSARVTCAH